MPRSDENSALIAMSGGVDSSMAAWLVLQKGWRCMGAAMRLWPEGEDPVAGAAEVCAALGIPFEALELTGLFEEQVIRPFIRSYEAGDTPNPCILCNRAMKFGRLLDAAEERGLHYVVTGHYARVDRDEDGRYILRRALDPDKDQSYVLWTLTQRQLSRILLPLGYYFKDEVRRSVAAFGLPCAHRGESQDICFVPDGDYAAFMERYTGRAYPEGDFLSPEGRVLGRHRGAVRYTLGQRRGLDLPMGERVYVCGKDMERNTVTVGPESALFSNSLTAGEMNWISIDPPDAPLRVKAKARYRQTEQDATVTPLEGGLVRVEFDQPQRAVTPGQSVVLYDGDIVVGGGIIRSTE